MKLLQTSALVLLLSLSNSWPILLAQDAQPSAQQGTDLLPDINPQDIEIKGDYRIRFPGLQRQPILGFDPKPRVFQLKADRMPFMETYDEVVASIPLTPLEIPTSPVKNMRKLRQQKNLWVLGGFGNRLSPEAEVGFVSSEPSNYSLNGFFSHLSSPDLGFSVPSSFYNWNTRLDYTNYIDKGLVWKTGFTSAFDKYQQPLNASSVESSNFNRFGFTTQLKSVKTPWDYWNATIAYSLFSQTVENGVSGESEHKVTVRLQKFQSLSSPQSGIGYGLDGNVASVSMQQKNQSYLIGSIPVWYSFNSGLVHHIKIGINPFYSSDSAKTGFFMYPELEYSYLGFTSSIIKVGVIGKVENGGRESYFTASRFLSSSQAMLNNRGYNAYLYWERDVKAYATLYAGLDALYYTQKGYINFIPSATDASIGRHTINFDAAQWARVKLGFSYRFPIPKISFQTELWYLTHQLPTLGTDIPFMERFGIKGSAFWRITNSWLFETELIFMEGRSGSFTSKNFFVAHAKTRYSLNKNWSVYLKAVNLTGSRYQYWAHFNEPPLFLTGGFTLRL